MSCEEFHILHDRCKKKLRCMHCGMAKENGVGFDLEKDNLHAKCALNLKKMFMSKREDYCIEAERRHYTQTKSTKKCKTCNVTRSKDHLDKNPIVDNNDLQFLSREEKSFYEMTKASNIEASNLSEVVSDNNADKWHGPKPWLQFYHATLEETVLEACRKTNSMQSREGLDGSNSDTRPKTFFELCCNKYNDPSFELMSNACPDLHDDFLEPLELNDADDCTVPLVAPNKLKDQLILVRCKVSAKTMNNFLFVNTNINGANFDVYLAFSSSEQMGAKW